MDKKVEAAERKREKTKRGFVFFAILAILVIVLAIWFAALGVELKYRAIEKKADAAEPAYRIGALYYNHLSYREQQLYDAIYTAACACAPRSEILPYIYESESFVRVAEYLRADCPELFYLDYSGLELLGERHASCASLKYHESAEKVAIMKEALADAIAAVGEQSELEDAEDEFGYELSMHDNLLEFCSFSSESTDYLTSTAYGALVLGEADAMGYAGAMKLLLDARGIYSVLVFGKTGETDHVWNIVYINDKFYHLDAAWNDSDLDFAEGIRFHGYFNLTSEAIAADHTMRDPELMPEANDPADYYAKRGLYVHNLIEFDRVAYREVLNAGYTGSDFIELCPTFTSDGEDFREQLITVIKRVNAVQTDFTFKEIYRTYNALEGGNAMTIQLYYDKKFTPADPVT